MGNIFPLFGEEKTGDFCNLIFRKEQVISKMGANFGNLSRVAFSHEVKNRG
jgi:hypothetical protein